MTDPKPRRFFASYLEVVERTTDPEVFAQRWQWIIMPRWPAHNYHVVFTRCQQYHGHRAMWRSYEVHEPRAWVMKRIAPLLTPAGEYQLRSLDHQNVLLREPVVVECAVADVTHTLLERKGAQYETPWYVLNQAKRVARRRGWKL